MKLNHRAEILTIRFGCPETVQVTVDTMRQDGETVKGELSINGSRCGYVCSKNYFDVAEHNPAAITPAKHLIESDRFLVALMQEVLDCQERNHEKLIHSHKKYHGR